VVTARAVKALKGLIPILAPLAVAGGQLALLEGQRLDSEIAQAASVLSRHHITATEPRIPCAKVQ